MKKVLFSEQCQKSKKVEKGVPFVVTYHPILNKLYSIIHRNLYLLFINQKVFTPGPLLSHRSARKICIYLVRKKLNPLERKTRYKKGHKSRCKVCFNIQETETIISTATSKSFKIHYKINCDDNCLFLVFLKMFP